MAKLNELSYGSQGSMVTQLQKMLNKSGYNLDEDGIFGTKTQTAVKDYQSKNALDVDGIVGTNTWGKLTSSNSNSISSTANLADKVKPGTVTGSFNAISGNVLGNGESGGYQSQWQTQLNDIMSKIMNREKFTYDMNSDALYQQYKDQYTNLGKQAMMDTIGQASAMTGGYGNSYAQSAGQQSYQGYLQQLNDKIPELYQLALDKYQMEGDEMMNQYGILADRENQDYGRYRDDVADSQWQKSFDYQQNRDAVADSQWQTAFDYQQERDQTADSQWQKEFDEAKRQFDATNKKSSSSSSSSSKSGSSSSSSKNKDKPKEEPKEEPKEQTNPTFKDVTKKCDDYIAAGASKSEISAYINEQRQLGYITAAQAQSLKATMTPRGLTY